MFNGKNQIPVLAPHDVAVFNGEAAELAWVEILVVLRMGGRRMKSPISTVCTVLSLNVRLTVRSPKFSALVMKSLSMSVPPYNILGIIFLFLIVLTVQI